MNPMIAFVPVIFLALACQAAMAGAIADRPMIKKTAFTIAVAEGLAAVIFPIALIFA